MISVNKNSDKIIMICFPIGGGGNFLINCLGLNEQAFFNNTQLIKKQIQKEFTVSDKLKYIQQEFNKIKNSWNDLSLGFGYHEPNSETFKHRHLQPVDYTSAVDNYYIFLHTHTIDTANLIISAWPNSSTILFYNSQKFLKWRKYLENLVQSDWDSIKGSDWPQKAPQSRDEFNSLSEKIINEFDRFGNKELLCDFKSKIEYNQTLLYYLELENSNFWADKHPLNTDNLIYWDNDWYFSEDKTIEQIKQLYSLFSLSNFNELAIRDYYRQWFATLEKLSNLDK